MKPCTFLDVDNCGNVDMKPVSTRVNWSGASRGLRTKGRTASIHCRPAPPRQTEALSSRTSRQPVFGSAVQDAQVPAGVPGPLRLDPGRAGPRPGLLRLVEHRTSPQRPRPAHAPRRALRLGRAARGHKATAALRDWERVYNFERFSMALYGETPAEKLYRLLPALQVA